MSSHKYIVVALDGVESIFTFPLSVDHDRMLEALQAIRFGSRQNWDRKLHNSKAVSAGFATDGCCHGRSETLGLSSRPKQDSALLSGGSS